jgi:hypothetical protein
MNIKLVFALSSVLIFSSCGSTLTKPSVSSIPAGTKYHIEKIDLKLTQSIKVDGYPDQLEFTKILTEKTINALKKNNVLADPAESGAMTAVINVNYQRHFAGEATPMPSKSVIAPTLDYTIILLDHGVEKNRIVKSGLTTGKGFAGNLGTVFTMGLGNTAKDELVDIEKLANAISSELIKVR